MVPGGRVLSSRSMSGNPAKEENLNSVVPPKKDMMRYQVAKYIHNILIPLIGVILAIIGWAKIMAVFGDAKILSELDPVIGVSNRLIMVITGIIEIPVGVMIIIFRRQFWTSLLLLWLSLNILTYRIMFWYANPPEPCPCLGNILDYLKIDIDSSRVSMIILIIMLLGSVMGILSKHFIDRYNAISNTGKINISNKASGIESER